LPYMVWWSEFYMLFYIVKSDSFFAFLLFSVMCNCYLCWFFVSCSYSSILIAAFCPASFVRKYSSFFLFNSSLILTITHDHWPCSLDLRIIQSNWFPFIVPFPNLMMCIKGVNIYVDTWILSCYSFIMKCFSLEVILLYFFIHLYFEHPWQL